MAHVKQGHLIASGKWWRHLRRTKRLFWKQHRTAERDEVDLRAW